MTARDAKYIGGQPLLNIVLVDLKAECHMHMFRRLLANQLITAEPGKVKDAKGEKVFHLLIN